MKRQLWRAWVWLKFQFSQKHRFDRLALEWVAGRPFLILPQVFNPTLFWTSEFMIQSLNERLISPGSRLLDMGTGSGVGAIFAAQWADWVTAVDINPAAVRCARINVLLNEVENSVTVKEGDLFTAVPGETFDVILFNPPYFSGRPQSDLDRAFRADDVIERFVEQLRQHLAPHGCALVLLSSEGNEPGFIALVGRHGYQIKIEARQELPTETLSLYKLQKEET